MANTPRLVFLPGAGGDPGFWSPTGDRLPAHWRKTYLGWPGLGRQPAAPGVNSLNDLVSLVEAQLGDEPVDLLAQSMGGVIAMMVVLRHTMKVRRLVLSVTSVGVAMGRLGAADWRETYRLNYPNAAPWVRDVQVDLSAELRKVMQPTLLLWGDADPISPVSVGHYLCNLLPSAELQVLRGGDHDVVHTRSSEAGPLIQRHLEASS